jgi:hypothetical protein
MILRLSHQPICQQSSLRDAAPVRRMYTIPAISPTACASTSVPQNVRNQEELRSILLSKLALCRSHDCLTDSPTPCASRCVFRVFDEDRHVRVQTSEKASLFGRTRKVKAQFSEAMTRRFRHQTDDPDYIRGLQLALLKQGELHYAEDLQRAITEIRTTMDASPSFYHVSALPNPVRSIVESLLARALHTIKVPPEHYYLISDCPVVTYEVQNG